MRDRMLRVCFPFVLRLLEHLLGGEIKNTLSTSSNRLEPNGVHATKKRRSTYRVERRSYQEGMHHWGSNGLCHTLQKLLWPFLPR